MPDSHGSPDDEERPAMDPMRAATIVLGVVAAVLVAYALYTLLSA